MCASSSYVISKILVMIFFISYKFFYFLKILTFLLILFSKNYVALFASKATKGYPCLTSYLFVPSFTLLPIEIKGFEFGNF